MKIVIAIDSFKGSLSTLEAGNGAKEGILRADPCAAVEVYPLADGGEGTLDAIIHHLRCERRIIPVKNPLGKTINAGYGISISDKTACLEMSAAAGITLINDTEKNPLYTTTYGVGEMIKDAILQGCRKFIVGIGGSATNDGGVGMLQALGFDFLDAQGKPVPYGAQGLEKIASICTDNCMPELAQCEFKVACDVKNVLCGENGCSKIFGPQKGADSVMTETMDGWMKRYAALTQQVKPKADPLYPGSGAAGGMGFAFLSYLNATLVSGIDLVIETIQIENSIKAADLVITGEGRLDSQSYMGKAPIGIANIAKKYHKPVIALSGAVTKDAGINNHHGIDAFFPILRRPCSLEEAMNKENAYANMCDTAEQVYRLIQTFY